MKLRVRAFDEVLSNFLNTLMLSKVLLKWRYVTEVGLRAEWAVSVHEHIKALLILITQCPVNRHSITKKGQYYSSSLTPLSNSLLPPHVDFKHCHAS